MKANYIDLFKERKWKEALDAMPVGPPRIVPIDSARELQILRVRASEFNRESKKTASITVDYEFDKDKEYVIATITKQ